MREIWVGPTDFERNTCLPISDATEADLPGILTIYNEVIRTSSAVYTDEEATLEDRRAWLVGRTQLGYPVLVAEDAADGSVLGYSTFGESRPWPGYRYTVEHLVYIRFDMRGRGLGGKLVEPLFARARGLGKHVMVAGIDAANPASLRLHERLGFERAGTLREVGAKFGGWLDLVFHAILPRSARSTKAATIASAADEEKAEGRLSSGSTRVNPAQTRGLRMKRLALSLGPAVAAS